MRQLALTSLMLIICISLSAQKHDSLSFGYFGITSHYGFIIPHTSAIEPVSHTRPYGFELSYTKLDLNYDSWRTFNCFNGKGVQLSYFNYQNPDILGNAYTLTVFTEPILVYNNRLIFSVKAGGGISYHTEIFDFNTDTLNQFFSTRISFPLYLMLRIKYRLAAYWYITFSGCYNHISNGATRVPNYGMNFPTMSLGIEYHRKELPLLDQIKYIADRNFVKESYLSAQLLTGYKDVYGRFYHAYGVDLRYNWHIRYHYALNAGTEFIMDQGIRRMIEIENKSVDYKRFAVTAGQDFLFGRITFTQYFGLYLYSPYEAKNMIYQKYELTYNIIRPLSAGFFLKAHTSEAELFGFCINYKIYGLRKK
jgi:hypothetical protein